MIFMNIFNFSGQLTQEKRNKLYTSQFLIFLSFILFNINGCKEIEPERIVKLKTEPVTDISYTSCSAHGTILDMGDSYIKQHGFCWGTTANPTLHNENFSWDDLGKRLRPGDFSFLITELSAQTKYYIRSYVQNSEKIYYGEELSFTTLDYYLPVVSTADVTDIERYSAKCGGNVTDDGYSQVIEKGICWSTDHEPIMDVNTTTTNGDGEGEFVSTLGGLTDGTTYYVRAYARNEAGVGYGEEKSFTTLKYFLPTVFTADVTDIQLYSAKCGGNITDDGGAEIKMRGVVWDVSPNPTYLNDKTWDGEGTGSYISNLTGLSPQTTYYVRAYADNEQGRAYGNEVIFITKSITGTFTDTRDNHIYNTVIINEKKWMAENLAYLPEVSPSNIASSSDPYYYVYDYQGANVDDARASSNYSDYGVLYNWTAAMAGAESNDATPGAIQGICPDGWHLPSDSEWKELEIFLGMSPSDANLTGQRGDIGGKLKEEGTEHWNPPNTGAVNSYSFTALPGGVRYYDNSFSSLSFSGYWWTSTEYSLTYAYSRVIDYVFTSIYRNYPSKHQGLSVRCIEGQGAHLPEVITSTPENITADGAILGGIVLDDGYDAIIEKGVYFGTNTSPQFTGTKYVMGSGMGSFSADLTGLTTGMTYYVVAFATNVAGTSYGEILTFVPQAK